MSEALLLTTGSRVWTDKQTVDNALWEAYCGLVVSGPFTSLRLLHGYCGRGADELVDRWALSRYDQGVRLKRVAADWYAECDSRCKPGHRRAGYCPAQGNYRNQVMVDMHPHAAIGFKWQDRSTGTQDCIDRAVVASIPTLIYRRGKAPVWANALRTAWSVD